MIQPPKYAKNALPRPNGWYVKNEKIVGRRHTQEEIDEYMAHINGDTKIVKEEEPKVAPPSQPIKVEKEIEVDPVIEAVQPELVVENKPAKKSKKRKSIWPFGSKK